MMVALAEAMLVGILAAEGISKKDEPRYHRPDWPSWLNSVLRLELDSKSIADSDRRFVEASRRRLLLEHRLGDGRVGR